MLAFAKLSIYNTDVLQVCKKAAAECFWCKIERKKSNERLASFSSRRTCTSLCMSQHTAP